jgi:peptidoglycan pentaglycine glycine transferase (the first glycine)
LIDFRFAYELSPGEKNEMESFYNSLEQVTLEQYPAWAAIEKGNFENCFFIARENGRIVCMAIIIERKAKIFRFAHIPFGPLFIDPESLVSSIIAIENHYRNKAFVFLTVQLAIETGNMADLIEYRLNRLLKIQTYFNRDNWSSIVLDLGASEDEIRRSFTKGHKSDLKKAEKNQISVTELILDEELEKFCQVYVKMYKERGLPIDEVQSHAFFRRIREFLKRTGRGYFLIVKDNSGQLLGGIVLLLQGKQVRYFKGASDPSSRHIPVLHLAIWEGIKKVKALGYHHFDFWGYNHFVTEDDQVFYINRFKKGFGGSYLFYPKKMYIVYRPFMYWLYELLTGFKGRIQKKSARKLS